MILYSRTQANMCPTKATKLNTITYNRKKNKKTTINYIKT